MQDQTEFAAYSACLLLLGLSVFQVLLAAGLPWGRFAWGGQHRVLPRRLRIGSILAVLTYAGIALVILDAAGLISVLPERVSAILIWVTAGYFLLGVGMNLISRSRPERITMTPVAVLLCVLTILVALE